MISIFLPDLRGGGAERVSLDLARGVSARGYPVEFVLMSAVGELLSEAQNEHTVVDLRAERVRHAIAPLRRYLRDRRPDALIVMMWPLTSIIPMMARFLAPKTRVLVCEHGILSQQYSSWGIAHNIMLRASTALGYRLADVRVGVSVGGAADMARLAGLAPTKVAAIFNGVRRLPHPSAAALDAADGLWGTAGPRMLTVGNLKAVKNHALILRAFATIRRPDARLMIVGSGDEKAALSELSQRLGIADRVIFAGFHKSPSAFYATADVFVLSSDHEGFGNVIVEALSFGLPVVSTDCPSGPAEILENGKWGRLVPVGDAAALARAMEEALAAPVDREALKRRAADFAPEIAARKYLDLLGLP